MKKWMIGASLLVFTSLQLAAQQERRPQPNPDERAKRMTEKMSTELELTEEQRDQILLLNMDLAEKRQVELAQEAAERKAKMEAMKAHQEKINAVLTPEQRTKWEEIKLEQRDKRRPGGQIHRRQDLPKRSTDN